MIILGIQLGHNATIALLKEGKIIRAVSQEKFDNIKNSSRFPEEAIKWALKDSQTYPEQIDYIAICGETIYPHQIVLTEESSQGTSLTIKEYLKFYLSCKYTDLYWKYINFKNKKLTKKARLYLTQLLARVLNLDNEEITKKMIFIKHHYCHAYSAYYSSPDRKVPALILTLDGSGDYSCATVNIYDGKEGIKRIASTNWIYSPGYVYSNVTKFLGMKPLEHEYKVMGLAPYAKERIAKEVCDRVFKPLLWLERDGLTFRSKIPTNRLIVYLKQNLCGIRFDVIAGALQMWLEELVLQWVKNAISVTGIRNLYFGGGVFMNVKLNKRIMELPEVEHCFFMPSCGDESNSFGACYAVYKQKTGAEPLPLENLYLGPEYTNEEIKYYLINKLNPEKYHVEYYEDIEKKVAELLANFQIVARFKGRAEWGARALGNRSILGNPSDLKTFYEINDVIKQRDFWMPFAPSILDEDEEKYIKNLKKVKAPYMILAFDSTELAQRDLKAALHQADKTLRPQIVYKEQNPDYWRLIKYFKDITGIGGVLNTSLNLHGYPLVATLDQLFFTLENSKLKYVAVGNFLIYKK